jgi:hypothetical protein
MQNVLGCIAAEPVAHWECDEAGVAAIREGYCDGEQQAFAACFQRSLASQAR